MIEYNLSASIWWCKSTFLKKILLHGNFQYFAPIHKKLKIFVFIK